MLERKTALIAFLLMSLVGICSLSNAGSDVTAEAKAMLSKNDPTYLIDKAAPFFYSHFGDERLTGLLDAVWEEDKKKYPDLAWKSLSDEEVRLKFATLWAQWIRESQKDKQKITEIRKFVLPYLKHPNPRLRLAAVTFTVGATDADVEKLVEIALQDERLVASAAVYSIIDIQGKRAQGTLSKIRGRVKDSSVRDTIDHAIKDADQPQFQGNR